MKSFPRFVNQKDYILKSLPIQIAASHNNVALVQILQEAGANVDQIPTNHNEPNYLLTTNPTYRSVTFARPERFTALFTVIWFGSHARLACLLEDGASTVFGV